MLLGAALVLPRAAQSQQVVVVVNGDPVTALDIEQRSKLNQLSTHKVPSRQEVLEELITEKLKIKEGKRLGFEISNNEVDSAFGNMASKMRLTVDQLTELLGKSGINPATLKHRIKADMTWPQLVRGRYSSSLQIGEKEIVTVTDNKPEESVGYDYTLRPILMIIPPGSPAVGFVKALAARGVMKNAIVIGQGEAEDPDLHLFDDSVKGFHSSIYYSSTSETPENKAFNAALKQKFGPDALPSTFTLGAYDAMGAGKVRRRQTRIWPESKCGHDRPDLALQSFRDPANSLLASTI